MSIGFWYAIRQPIRALAYIDKEFNIMKNKIKKLGLYDVIQVGRYDVQILESLEESSVEQVLLIDVLEHVYDDQKALNRINKILKANGCVIMSCPTHYYPHYFGVEFDQSIGHLRHYMLEDLQRLLEISGFKIVEYYYYTNSFTSLLCMIWYKRIKNNFMKLILLPILNVLSYFFEREDKLCRRHSSIAILAAKQKIKNCSILY